MPIEIRYEGNPAQGPRFAAGLEESEKIVIGRDATHCQVVFPADDTRVGRQHCTLEQITGRYRVRVNQEDVVLCDGRRVYDNDELPFERAFKLQLGRTGPILLVRTSLEGLVTDARLQDLDDSIVAKIRESAEGGRRGQRLALAALGIVLIVAAAVIWLSRSYSKRIDVALAEPQLGDALNKSIPSVYLVLIQDGNKFLKRLGTAWVVDQQKGLLATNAHIAEEFQELEKAKNGSRMVIHAPVAGDQLLAVDRVQIHPGYDAWHKLWTQFEPVEQTSAVAYQSVASFGAACDVALIHVENSAALAPALQVADAKTLNGLKAGEPLGLVGYPVEELALGGATIDDPIPTVQFGHLVRMTNYFGVVDVSPEDRFLVSHSAPATGGASGSPLINRRGEVVAINSAGNILPLYGPGDGGEVKIVGRIPSAALINFGQRIDLVNELLSGTADERLKPARQEWEQAFNKHFRPRRATARSALVPQLTSLFDRFLAGGVEYKTETDKTPLLANVEMARVEGSSLPEWRRQVVIDSPGIYFIAAVGEGDAPLRLTVSEPIEEGQVFRRKSITIANAQVVRPFAVAGRRQLEVTAKSLSDVKKVYLTVLSGRRSRRTPDELHQNLADGWQKSLKTTAKPLSVVEAARLAAMMPPPPALERDLDGKQKPNDPAEKAVRFPKLSAGHYLVTLVTKNGEDVRLSVNDGAYVQADGTAGQRSEATGACLSFDVTLWDDGPIVGKLTGDRRITDAIWSDAAGREFLAPTSGGDAKSGERRIEYELRLYRASDGPNAAGAASAAAPGGKMNPVPGQKRS
jgi:hypothetical protein